MDNRRRRRVSLDLLRGFCVAARHLSFTRAAQELYVTQSAISHEIKTLEQQLGQPLFRRVNRTLELTRAGRELLDATEQALELLDRALDRVGPPAGQVLAVTTTTSLASLWLAPRLALFTRLHPGINVRIAAVNDMVNVDLEREHLDVAIRFVPPGWDIPGGERIVDYQTFPVCAPQLAQAGTHPLRTPADLAQHVLLDFERMAFGRTWSDWDHWFEGVNLTRIEASGTLHFSHYDQVIQAALEGSGVAIGKRPHLTRYLERGLLCAPFGRDWVANPGSFYLVVAPSAREREPVAAFVTWLRSQVREPSALERPVKRPNRPRK
jgi:LysR family transcriptional regulator, glycine cleavage system transcriptional activator